MAVVKAAEEVVIYLTKGEGRSFIHALSGHVPEILSPSKLGILEILYETTTHNQFQGFQGFQGFLLGERIAGTRPDSACVKDLPSPLA